MSATTFVQKRNIWLRLRRLTSIASSGANGERWIGTEGVVSTLSDSGLTVVGAFLWVSYIESSASRNFQPTNLSNTDVEISAKQANNELSNLKLCAVAVRPWC